MPRASPSPPRPEPAPPSKMPCNMMIVSVLVSQAPLAQRHHSGGSNGVSYEPRLIPVDGRRGLCSIEICSNDVRGRRVAVSTHDIVLVGLRPVVVVGADISELGTRVSTPLFMTLDLLVAIIGITANAIIIMRE
mgnify:CR=1 FL=1